MKLHIALLPLLGLGAVVMIAGGVVQDGACTPDVYPANAGPVPFQANTQVYASFFTKNIGTGSLDAYTPDGDVHGDGTFLGMSGGVDTGLSGAATVDGEVNFVTGASGGGWAIYTAHTSCGDVTDSVQFTIVP